jgi:hypothetical protein
MIFLPYTILGMEVKFLDLRHTSQCVRAHSMNGYKLNIIKTSGKNNLYNPCNILRYYGYNINT